MLLMTECYLPFVIIVVKYQMKQSERGLTELCARFQKILCLTVGKEWGNDLSISVCCLGSLHSDYSREQRHDRSFFVPLLSGATFSYTTLPPKSFFLRIQSSPNSWGLTVQTHVTAGPLHSQATVNR